MKMFFALFVLALFPLCGFGQEAKVIALDAADAASVKSKWDAFKAAEKAWADEQERIRTKYLTVPYGDPEAGYADTSSLGFSTGTTSFILSRCDNLSLTNQPQQDSNCLAYQGPSKEEERKEEERRRKARYHRKGWDNGFQSSSDFRFIVPKAYQPSSNCATQFSTPAHCLGNVCW